MWLKAPAQSRDDRKASIMCTYFNLRDGECQLSEGWLNGAHHAPWLTFLFSPPVKDNVERVGHCGMEALGWKFQGSHLAG